jgi:predicted DNA-binding transcriptional regulator AlpA
MKLISARIVRNRYGRSDRTIDRWVEDGELPQPIYIRRLRYWDEEELDRRDEARKAAVALAGADETNVEKAQTKLAPTHQAVTTTA